MQQGIWICPRCQNRFVRSSHTGDYEHQCFGQEVLANDSILVLGDWVDYTGSDSNVQNALMQGQENNLFGTRAWIEGQKFQSRDSRGFPTDRFRSRQHIEHIESSFFNKSDEKQPDNPEEYEESHN